MSKQLKKPKSETGAARSARKPKKIAKPKPQPEYKADVFEEYSNEDTMETLIENLSGKLKFHIFNPDKYEIQTHKNIIIVPPDHRKTSEIMTEYEWTEVISHRAKHIENGGPVFCDVGTESNPIKMAELELKMKRCPLAIRRVHNGLVGEIWHCNEMITPH